MRVKEGRKEDEENVRERGGRGEGERRGGRRGRGEEGGRENV